MEIGVAVCTNLKIFHSYFSGYWYKYLDKNGDGYEIDFPVQMKTSIKWTMVIIN